VANALNHLDAAQAQVRAAQDDVDVALAEAMKLHVPAHQLRQLFCVSPATFWRRAKAAREAVGA
jgi:hypothetical protein